MKKSAIVLSLNEETFLFFFIFFFGLFCGLTNKRLRSLYQFVSHFISLIQSLIIVYAVDGNGIEKSEKDDEEEESKGKRDSPCVGE